MSASSKREWNKLKNFIDFHRKQCNGKFEVTATEYELTVQVKNEPDKSIKIKQ